MTSNWPRIWSRQALARTHLAWGRLRDTGNADAYVRKIMYHQQVSAWRRRRVAEFLPGTLPEATGSADHAQSTAVRGVAARTAGSQYPGSGR